MASIYPNGLASANTIRQQRQRLNSLIGALETRLRNERKPSRNLVSLLNALAVHLQTYFEAEESDGYLSNLANISPGLSTELERMLQEHAELVAEVSNLVKLAREDFSFNHNTDYLAHCFNNFQTKLAAHEHEENKIIQEAYNLDLGTKD